MTQALHRRALVVATLALALLATACGEAEIVHGLDEREANAILVVLDTEEIEARKEIEEGRVITWKVLVPAKHAADARRLLVDYELPQPRSNRLKDVFAEGGMIPTQSEEKAKMLVGIQGEIEQKLKLIPGVLDVHAQVVIPDKEAVRDVAAARPLPMAAVVIVYLPLDGKLPYNVEDVQKAVAASVEDMTPERVTVLSYPQRTLSSRIRGKSGGADCPQPAAGAATAGAPCPPVKKIIGVEILSSRTNMTKFFSLLAVLGGLVVLLLVLTMVFLIGRIGLKRQLRKALAENLSYKKARGAAPAELPNPNGG
jgi:type III secretion protein J